jgi:hypothetical protein
VRPVSASRIRSSHFMREPVVTGEAGECSTRVEAARGRPHERSRRGQKGPRGCQEIPLFPRPLTQRRTRLYCAPFREGALPGRGHEPTKMSARGVDSNGNCFIIRGLPGEYWAAL